MARAIGLDIGAGSIKVVELGGSKSSPKIQRLAVREIPKPPADAEDYDADAVLAAEIKSVFAELQLPKDDVCASFDSGVTVFREIMVPFLEEDQIKKVIRFEAENHLHNHAIEDVVVNWIKTGQTRDGSRVMIFASPKDELARRMSILRKAGITPASVDLDTTALFTALQTVNKFEENPNCIVLDVGTNTTNLIMVVDGKPRVMRSFLLGAGGVEEAAAAELGVSSSEGRERVLQSATSASEDLLVSASELDPPTHESDKSLAHLQKDAVEDRRTDFVRKLHREAIRSLLSVRADAPPEMIMLLGGGALIPHLPDALSESFGLPVERVNLLDSVECKDPGPAPDYTGSAIGAAIGCGLRMMGRRGLGVELLQDEFSPSNTFDVIKTPLCVAITLAFLGVLGVTYIEREKLSVEKIEYANWAWNAQNMYMRVEPEFLNKVRGLPLVVSGKTRKGKAITKAVEFLKPLEKSPKKVTEIRNRLQDRHRFLQTKLGLARDIPELPSALETWVEVYNALNSVGRDRYGDWFQVSRLQITPTRLDLRLILSEETDADKILKALSNSDYLKNRAASKRGFVTPGSKTRLQDGKVRLEFSMKFAEEQ